MMDDFSCGAIYFDVGGGGGIFDNFSITAETFQPIDH